MPWFSLNRDGGRHFVAGRVPKSTPTPAQLRALLLIAPPRTRGPADARFRGYSAGCGGAPRAKVQRLMAQDASDFPMPEIDSNGVDLSQIRYMLSLSPLERLQLLEAALASMMKVRHAAGSAAVPRDPDSSG
jgi:hypothetical protein